jgi:GT2 family glycosyltransferase
MSAVPNELIESPQPHHQVLEIMAAKALARRDFGAAFKLADRRCRIEPPPLAHSYVLRADASYNMGDKIAAIADLRSALDISPHDVAATRRLFAWGDESARRSAASDLIAQERDIGTLRAILETLSLSGQRRLAALSVYDRYVTGWAVWDQDEAAELTIASEDGVVTSLLTPDPFHPLSSLRVRATSFHLARPASSAPQMTSIAVQGERFFSQRMPPNGRRTAAPEKIHNSASVSSDDLPAVIVPVYADFKATKACLESLIADDSSPKNYRILIVNDASPEQAISKYLAALAKRTRVEVLTNSINLGFVGSVNRALSRLSAGDVVLLNADTLVPPGFVRRLKAIASGSDDIGTVVPLSNNGGISDFPNPHHHNPLGSRDDVIRLDRLAAKANQVPIDIPNGTGFCLYVTRACLNAVGGLSETFQRGYLEDIDFCLRAREHGFRHVCATSVYVGHAGSRSFQAEKRSLVLQNLGVLDQRFAKFRAECAAFIAADPLRPARQAIERLMPPPKRRPVLIMNGIGALQAVAQARAHQLLSADRATIFLEIVSQNKQTQIRFRAADQAAPQSLSFPLSPSGLRDLRAYLRKLRPTHCEIIDPVNTPAPLTRILTALKIPFDIWLADGRSIAPGVPSAVKGRAAKAGSRSESIGGVAIEPDMRVNEKRLREIVSAARHLVAPCPASKGFATGAPPGRKTKLQELPINPLSLRHDLIQPRPPNCLAVVPTRASAKEFSMIRTLALTLQRRQSDIEIFVAGSTFDDLRLMTHGNVFVAGPIDVADLGRVLQPHHVGWLLTGFDGPLFGHPLIGSVRQANVPVAFIDWCAGSIPSRPGDLAIYSGTTIDQATDQIVSWIEGTIS